MRLLNVTAVPATIPVAIVDPELIITYVLATDTIGAFTIVFKLIELAVETFVVSST